MLSTKAYLQFVNYTLSRKSTIGANNLGKWEKIRILKISLSRHGHENVSISVEISLTAEIKVLIASIISSKLMDLG